MQCTLCLAEMTTNGCSNLSCPTHNGVLVATPLGGPVPITQDDIQQKLDRLRAALRRYGGHEVNCDAYPRAEKFTPGVFVTRLCTCGYTVACLD